MGSLNISPCLDRASGFKVSFTLEGGNNELLGRIEQLLVVEKMEGILGISRDVRMVIRWIGRVLARQGQKLWLGLIEKPVW